MKFICTSDAPAAGGHYSQAVIANGFIFVAGQLPVMPGGGMPEGVEAQTRQSLTNVATILTSAGSSLGRIVNATVYVRDIALWPEINRVYAEMLGSHKPARTVTVSPQLHYDALIEIQVVALIG
jgi:2-iminobutanoate/2-iminopropanoate deaminase